MIHLDSNPEIPLYRRIVMAVQKAIATGALAAGDKLPPQLALARDLGVNPTTVRNAYEMLENQKLIVSKPGSGTYVLADAKQRLERIEGKRFGDIAVVLGVPHLADFNRNMQRMAVDILAGMEEGLQNQFDRFIFVEKTDTARFEALRDDSAVLLWQANEIDPQAFESLQQRNIPVVGVWGDPGRLPIPHMGYDVYQASRIACQHLVDCGYQRIGFIGDMGRTLSLGVKFFEFTNVLYTAGLDFQVRHVRDVPNANGLAYEAMRDIIDNGDLPQAFYVDTDDKAMEVVHALKKAGLKVPEDVGIVSYNDIPEAAEFDPPLTTVRTPRRKIGREVARLFLAWSQQKPAPVYTRLDSELIIRRSTSMTPSASCDSKSVQAKASSDS